MLIRLLIYTALGLLVYRAVRPWIRGGGAGPAHGPVTAPEHIDDIMLKDPVCGIYFPKAQAVVWNGPGGALHFCSTACRDRYLRSNP